MALGTMALSMLEWSCPPASSVSTIGLERLAALTQNPWLQFKPSRGCSRANEALRRLQPLAWGKRATERTSEQNILPEKILMFKSRIFAALHPVSATPGSPSTDAACIVQPHTVEVQV
jgi:hypothetical protein